VWGAQDVGGYLERQAAWQVLYARAEHNEFIVGARAWNEALPTIIAAFFVTSRASAEAVEATRAQHAAFLAKHPTSHVPLVSMDPLNFSDPFAPLDTRGRLAKR
jgi:hypothetical protein